MNRSEKQQLIDELHKELEQAPNAVLLDFKGLSVPAATEFRKKMRASGSRYRVVKNSLALRAAKGTALERLEAKLEGYTGIAYTGDDPVALAKVLHDFIKAVLFQPLVVAAALVIGGILILVIERLHPVETLTDGTRLPVRTTRRTAPTSPSAPRANKSRAPPDGRNAAQMSR